MGETAQDSRATRTRFVAGVLAALVVAVALFVIVKIYSHDQVQLRGGEDVFEVWRRTDWVDRYALISALTGVEPERCLPGLSVSDLSGSPLDGLTRVQVEAELGVQSMSSGEHSLRYSIGGLRYPTFSDRFSNLFAPRHCDLYIGFDAPGAAGVVSRVEVWD